jgi:hypothetical protein
MDNIVTEAKEFYNWLDSISGTCLVWNNPGLVCVVLEPEPLSFATGTERKNRVPDCCHRVLSSFKGFK